MAGMPLVFRMIAPDSVRPSRGSGARMSPAASRRSARTSRGSGRGMRSSAPADGSFAEYATAAGTDKIAPKPANLGFEQAATVPTTGTTALQALRNAGGR